MTDVVCLSAGIQSERCAISPPCVPNRRTTAIATYLTPDPSYIAHLEALWAKWQVEIDAHSARLSSPSHVERFERYAETEHHKENVAEEPVEVHILNEVTTAFFLPKSLLS